MFTTFAEIETKQKIKRGYMELVALRKRQKIEGYEIVDIQRIVQPVQPLSNIW